MRKTRIFENRDYGKKTVLILNIIKIWWRKRRLTKIFNLVILVLFILI